MAADSVAKAADTEDIEWPSGRLFATKRSFFRLGGDDMRHGMIRLALALTAAHAAAAIGQSAAMGMAAPQSFATPEAGAKALAQAVKANDLDALQAIFGADASRLLHSGDDVADAHNRQRFSMAYNEAHKLVSHGAESETLVVGKDQWPMPIPLVKHGGGWMFDTLAGEDEILRRRIGRNELSAMRVCEAIVAAEHQYATQHLDGDGMPVYTARMASSPQRHDGLYWPTPASEQPSPLGLLLANAAAEGYDNAKDEPLAPYHGYYYRILTRQGKAAAGGERDYVVHGKLMGGFAVLAYPAQYRASGVMSFIVDREGAIYAKDLGADTEQIVASLTSFDPDPSWKHDGP